MITFDSLKAYPSFAGTQREKQESKPVLKQLSKDTVSFLGWKEVVAEHKSELKEVGSDIQGIVGSFMAKIRNNPDRLAAVEEALKIVPKEDKHAISVLTNAKKRLEK